MFWLFSEFLAIVCSYIVRWNGIITHLFSFKHFAAILKGCPPKSAYNPRAKSTKQSIVSHSRLTKLMNEIEQKLAFSPKVVHYVGTKIPIVSTRGGRFETASGGANCKATHLLEFQRTGFASSSDSKQQTLNQPFMTCQERFSSSVTPFLPVWPCHNSVSNFSAELPILNSKYFISKHLQFCFYFV